MHTLRSLFSLESEEELRACLDEFVPQALADAAVWDSPRTSDGVAFCRVVDRSPTRVCVCGRIWSIDQTLHPFWLDVESSEVPSAPFRWTLYFDVDVALLGARRAGNLLDVIRQPTEVDWVVELTGSE